MNFPGSVPAGHPLLQGESWQRRHLDASSIAVLKLKPFSISSPYSFFVILLMVVSHSFYMINFMVFHLRLGRSDVQPALFFSEFLKKESSGIVAGHSENIA